MLTTLIFAYTDENGSILVFELIVIKQAALVA